MNHRSHGRQMIVFLISRIAIDPYGIHYGMIKASDLVLVNEDGKPVTPTKYRVNKAGFMIHAALHKARPDVNAACHTHSKYGRAWSAFGRPIEMLNQGKSGKPTSNSL